MEVITSTLSTLLLVSFIGVSIFDQPTALFVVHKWDNFHNPSAAHMQTSSAT